MIPREFVHDLVDSRGTDKVLPDLPHHSEYSRRLRNPNIRSERASFGNTVLNYGQDVYRLDTGEARFAVKLLKEGIAHLTITDMQNTAKNHVVHVMQTIDEGGHTAFDIITGNGIRAGRVQPENTTDYSAETVGFALAIRLAAKLHSVSRYNKQGVERDEVQGSPYPCPSPKGAVPYTHDDRCSTGAESGNWSFWWPCAGSFKVNILDCCREHDRRLFCARNEWDVMRADNAFAACVSAALVWQAEKEMS